MQRARSLVVLFGFLLVSCTGIPPVSDKAVAYNQEVADATNRIFLINTLRASEHLPLYYTRINTLQGEGVLSPKISAPFDIGPRGSDIVKFATELSGSQKDTIAIAVLDDQKFVQGILTPVPGKLIGFYLDQGWPPELVLHLVLERLDADAKTIRNLKSEVLSACKGNSRQYCKMDFASLLESCASQGPHFDNRPPKAQQPASTANFLCFQTIVRALLVLDLKVGEGTTLKLEATSLDSSSGSLQHLLTAADKGFAVVYDKDRKPFLCRKVSQASFRITTRQRPDSVRLASFADGPPNPCSTQDAKDESANLKIVPVTRSPDSMLYYLGEVARANFDNQSSILIAKETPDGLEQRGLFIVAKGDGGDAAQVTVSYDGQSYFIPRSVPAATPQSPWGNHRSMQTIAFVNQAFGLLKEASVPPVIPTFTVLPN